MHVFISYFREDSIAVNDLAKFLRRNGVDVWLDKDKISAGQRWQIAIREAIENGAFFLACFSSGYANRNKSYMNEELTIAIDEIRKRPADSIWFIPVLLDGSTIPNRPIGARETLRDLYWVDLNNNWDGGIKEILSVVKPLFKQKDEGPLQTNSFDALHHAVRYLQSRVFYVQRRHNPIFLMIDRAVNYLGYALKETELSNASSIYTLNDDFRGRILESAIEATFELSKLSNAARQAMFFRNVNRHKALRYVTSQEEAGLANDVNLITLGVIPRSLLRLFGNATVFG